MCRYGQQDIPTVNKIELQDDGVSVVYLNSSVSGIAPGQSGVFYQGDCLIGGGFFVGD
jgi:tRNA U34 2-thiouridine synthase MnmA/TrmU